MSVLYNGVRPIYQVKKWELRNVGTNSRCPFHTGVCLIESQIKGVKKGSYQL